MGMGGHYRRGASKMFLVETKSGHSNTNYLEKEHKYKTKVAGDYSVAQNKFISQSHKSRNNISISDLSKSCKSDEDCKKYVGNPKFGYEDSEVADGDLVCDKEWNNCIGARK